MRVRGIGAAVGAMTIVVGALAVPSAEGRADEGFAQRALHGLKAILANTQSILARIGDIGEAVDDLQFTAENLSNACAPPDLLPVPLDYPAQGFCRINAAGNLVVQVRNQGAANAGDSTVRITFDVNGSAFPVDAFTDALGPNASDPVEIPGGLPDGCFASDSQGASACNFLIAVDVNDQVSPEADQANNNAVGACFQVQ